MSEIRDILAEGFSLEALVARISLPGLVATLGVALGCALAIYFTYRFFYPGVIYSANFNLLLVLVTLVTAMIIMTISSNIILSLGMVGALSIVRFRTAVKDPLDVGFLFLGIGAGLTAGAGLYLIAVCGTLMILLVFIAMRLLRGGKTTYMLIVSYPTAKEEQVAPLLKAAGGRLKNKTVGGEETEVSVEVKVKRDDAAVLQPFTSSDAVTQAILLEFPGEQAV